MILLPNLPFQKYRDRGGLIDRLNKPLRKYETEVTDFEKGIYMFLHRYDS